jgi:hypothetical protein
LYLAIQEIVSPREAEDSVFISRIFKLLDTLERFAAASSELISIYEVDEQNPPANRVHMYRHASGFLIQEAMASKHGYELNPAEPTETVLTPEQVVK